MNVIRVMVCAVFVLCTVVVAPAASRAEQSKIVLVPESARPVWNWLQRVTAPNEPFLDRTAAAREQRAWAPRVLYGNLFDPFVTPRSPLRATRFTFTVGNDRWWVVADRTRRLVYYGESCCAFARAMVTTYDTPPPQAVADADLAAFEIPVNLGDTPAQTYAALGTPKRRWTAPGTTRWAATYAHPWWSDERQRAMNANNPCGYDITAIFARDRLVGYEVWRGC